MSTFNLQFKAMGSHMQVWLSVNSAAEAQVLVQVPAWFEEWEAKLSRFRPNSELSHLNAHTGEWLCVSPVLFEVISEARDAAKNTDGMFNPLILNALEALGYDQSFDPKNSVDRRPLPSDEAIPAWQSIQMDEDRQSVFLPHGTRIDLGGIGKGWAAEEAAYRLAPYGACLIDAGGDFVARGSPDDSGGWKVSVPNLDESDDLFTLLLKDEALATSGTDYHRWQRAGQTVHHLIDPRTGRPSHSAVVRASVVAEDAIDAVIWAKVSLMTQTFPQYPTTFIYRDGAVRSNVEIKEHDTQN